MSELRGRSAKNKIDRRTTFGRASGRRSLAGWVTPKWIELRRSTHASGANCLLCPTLALGDGHASHANHPLGPGLAFRDGVTVQRIELRHCGHVSRANHLLCPTLAVGDGMTPERIELRHFGHASHANHLDLASRRGPRAPVPPARRTRTDAVNESRGDHTSRVTR